MKKAIVMLVCLGFILGGVFADDTDYRGFKIRNTDPSGETLQIWNCQWSQDGAASIYMELTLSSPFEENEDVEIYVYNPNKGEWFHHHTCKNIDDDIKRCDFYVPVYWGMSENNTGYIDLVKAELNHSGEIYSKTFNFHISHERTGQELVILSKIAEFEEMMADLDCPEQGEGFESVVSETMALGRECRLDEARTKITTAINELEEAKADTSVCGPAEEPQGEGPQEETSAPEEEEEQSPAEEEPVEETTSEKEPSETEGGGICPAGFVLLLAALAGFAWRTS
ncbi:MAG: hypothetical protein ACLFUZ_01995 [Candidatus Micrarchaeia archaeon]